MNVVTVGPALLVTGLVLNHQGEKVLTRADEFVQQVAVAVANQAAFRSGLAVIDRRVDELRSVLTSLHQRAVAALDHLEALDFDASSHGRELRDALTLTTAMRDVVTTPVLEEDGALNDETTRTVLKYRDRAKHE